MMWHNVWAVIRREYLQRVRSKAFIFTTIGLPIFMAAVFVVPVYFASQSQDEERRLAVVDHTGVLYDRILAGGLGASGWELRLESGPDIEATLRRGVDEGEVGGFVVVDARTLETGDAVMYTADRPSAFDRLALRTAISRAALEHGLAQSGVDADALLRGGELRVEVLSESGSGMEDPDFLVSYIGAFMLYITTLMYAVAVMRATLEEKTSRIVEVIISSMKPWHLMLGKILGVGALSLTQLSIWLLAGALIGGAGIPAMLAARPDMVELAGISDILPGLGLVILFVGFFLFGFFMYAGLYACVGAMCNTDQEAQQAQAPLVVFVIAPIMLVIPVIEAPLGTMAFSLSLFPLFTPILMWARVTSASIPVWQVALSFALMALAVVAIAWLAGRIYKTGILMTGKRPTLPELWRWVKEA
jgi:ABC-2 type transport system permease protein